jgi:hypothetical protein
MLGSDKSGSVHASVTASSARSRDIYQRYAVALYRQALLALDDSAPAEDAVADECALAPGPERGEDDARYHLAESVFRCCYRLVAGSARQDRRAGLSGGLWYIRGQQSAGNPSA